MLTYDHDVDKRLAGMLEHMELLCGIDVSMLKPDDEVKIREVYQPNDAYAFLHEAAIIEFKGTLYASWYNCPKYELKARTPIRGRRSRDGGITWSEIETIADDETGRILYCPPVYGICDGRLYLLLNEMVAPDHIHALDLYVLNEETDRFEKLWSRPIPFKLNTNVVTLSNGKLMLPGRIAELDGFPNTPAVLISDSGKIDAQWRLVKVQSDGMLPDGAELVHPELTAIPVDHRVYLFSRDDPRRVPLLYVSEDDGEHWSAPVAHDIPLSSSKIYAGTLSDGRNYLIGNLYPERGKLAVFFSTPNTVQFTNGIILQDGFSPLLQYGKSWHYPSACESSADGKLYIIYTVTLEDNTRGAVMSVIPLP